MEAWIQNPYPFTYRKGGNSVQGSRRDSERGHGKEGGTRRPGPLRCAHPAPVTPRSDRQVTTHPAASYSLTLAGRAWVWRGDQSSSTHGQSVSLQPPRPAQTHSDTDERPPCCQRRLRVCWVHVPWRTPAGLNAAPRPVRVSSRGQADGQGLLRKTGPDGVSHVPTARKLEGHAQNRPPLSASHTKFLKLEVWGLAPRLLLGALPLTWNTF